MNFPHNSFAAYDKGMDIVTAVLGEEPTENYKILVQDGGCKVVMPAHVSLNALQDRDDLTINVVNNACEIVVQ